MRVLSTYILAKSLYQASHNFWMTPKQEWHKFILDSMPCILIHFFFFFFLGKSQFSIKFKTTNRIVQWCKLLKWLFSVCPISKSHKQSQNELHYSTVIMLNDVSLNKLLIIYKPNKFITWYMMWHKLHINDCSFIKHFGIPLKKNCLWVKFWFRCDFLCG